MKPFSEIDFKESSVGHVNVKRANAGLPCRVPSGVIVLLELKTREMDRPYLSDVIELSARCAAIALQTGEGLGSRIRRRPESWQRGAKDPSGETDAHGGGESPAKALPKRYSWVGWRRAMQAGRKSAAGAPLRQAARNSKTVGAASMKRSGRYATAVDTYATVDGLQRAVGLMAKDIQPAYGESA